MFDNFFANFLANLAAAFLLGCLAFLNRGSIGNYIKKITGVIPNLELYFPDGKKTLEIEPCTNAEDYDISFRPVIENSGQIPFNAPETYLHVFIPKEVHQLGYFTQNASKDEWDSKYIHYTINLSGKIPIGFSSPSFRYDFRITKPQKDDFIIYYYFQTPYGYFPKTFKINGHKEIPETGGQLTIKLLNKPILIA